MTSRPVRRLIGVAAILALAFPLTGRTSPQAAPAASPTAGEAPLAVTFSPNNSNGSFYQWQFNSTEGFVPDYSSEIGEDVSHTYPAQGTYTARLRIYDAITGAATDTDFTITVYPPAAPPTVALTFSPYPTLPDQNVTFTAAAVPSPGRSIVAYSWDFNNDGIEDTSSPGGPSATAASSFGLPLADYTVTVTAVDNGGLAGKDSTVVRTGVPPAICFTQALSRLTSPGVPVDMTVLASTTSWGIDHYDWDFGGGTGTVNAGGGSASVTFAAAGNYTVTATVTDEAGHSTSATLPVQVSNPPAALLARHKLAPYLTTYTVMTLVPPGDTILGYHWDITGDAADDRTYPSSATITVNPSDNCKPTITVTVDFQTGTDPTATAPFEMEIPTGMVVTPIPITLTAAADGAPAASPVNIRVGHAVNFLATAGNSGDANLVLKEILWDFDGDGLRDQLDNLLPLNTNSVTDIPASFQYRNPGTFVARARVIDTTGGSGEAIFTVNVAPGTAPLECFIAQPRDGQRVWGNHVSLQAKASPAVLTRMVEFRCRLDGSADPWTTIGTAVPPPYTALSVPWDVTGLVPGSSYEILAVATDTSDNTAFSDALQKVVVTVDPVAPDEEENFGDILVRTHTIDPNIPTRSEIAQDTAIEFPPHAFGMEYTTIRLERPFSNPHPLEARLQQLQFVPGSFRRLALDGGSGLQQPSKIALYDINPNGILDDLKVDKSSLRIYQFDDTERKWVPLFGQVVQPGEDLARATLMSMGDVGLVIEYPPRAPSGASHACGLLGPELLVLALLAVRRRVRV